MILLFGSNGQVGTALKKALGNHAISVTREDVDLSNSQALEAFLARQNITAIINAAAYTKVDQAEHEEELVFAINTNAPTIMASYCFKKNIPFIHYSTDYVFSGNKGRPWKEEDRPSPLSVYGASKAMSEENISNIGGKYLIFRTSWVYDIAGNNFLKTMLKFGKERETLRVVNDQIGAPTYAPEIAKASIKALEFALTQESFPSGIYHLCNKGVTSWHGFAEAIFELARLNNMNLKIKKVEEITSMEFPTVAKRPYNSKLNLSKIKKTFGITMPDWYKSLKECMAIVSSI